MKFRISDDQEYLILTSSTNGEHAQLLEYLSRFVQNYRFMPRFKLTPWDGKISYFNNGRIRIGLWKEVKNCCDKYGFPFEVENPEQFPLDKGVTKEKLLEFAKTFFDGYKTPDGKEFFPYDHQLQTCYKILRNRYCTIEVGTGGGKSLTLAMLVFYVLKEIDSTCKFLFIVPSISLVHQLYNDIEVYNRGWNNEQKNPVPLRMREVMSQKPREAKNPNVVIGTYQSIKTLTKKELEVFDYIGVDECLHPETLIMMEDDSQKKIKDVLIKDRVKTINDLSGEVEIREVEEIYKNLSNSENVYELELQNGKKITITGNHKVKLIDGSWIRVDELSLEDEIFHI